jgi:hypothetical protein
MAVGNFLGAGEMAGERGQDARKSVGGKWKQPACSLINLSATPIIEIECEFELPLRPETRTDDHA